MTRVKCDLSMCKYNSSCCTNPHERIFYCNKDNIEIIFDEEISSIDCKNYTLDVAKQYECSKCQIKKYGAINIKRSSPEFIIEESDDVPY